MSKQSAMALKINGREYRRELSDDEAKQAADDGLIIVHGGSDDLCYFSGVFADEKSAWEVNTWWWTGSSFEQVKELITTEPYEFWIDQKWCPDDKDCSWGFETNIPKTARFIVREGDEIYGEGLVINTEYLKCPN